MRYDGSVSPSVPSPADIRAALEDLRTADRILLSVEGTTQFLKRQQLLDLVGVPTADGLFGEETRRDNHHANDELLVAQQAMTDALRRLGIAADAPPEELKIWGRLDGILDHVWTDFLALDHACANRETAGRVRARVRALFATIVEAHPEAAAGVAPLTDPGADADIRPPVEWVKIGVGVVLVGGLALIALLS